MSPFITVEETESVGLGASSQSGGRRRKVAWTKVYKGVRNLIAASNDVHWYDYQKEIAQRIVKAVMAGESEEITIMMSRQSGKTECVADTCLGLMILLPEILPNRFKDGFHVGFFAPTYDQSKIIYNRLRDRFKPQVLSILGMSVQESNGDTFRLSNGSFAKCLTADKDSVKEGYTFHILIVDEAQNVETQVIQKSLWPMTSATSGPKIMIGTATTQKRYFYEVQVRDKGTDRCFIYNVDRVIEDRRRLAELKDDPWHLMYEKDFLQQLRTRGKDDNIRMAYYLEWVLEHGMFITKERLLDLALPYDRVREYPFEVYAGLDIAKEVDRTVLTIETLHCPRDMAIKTSDGETRLVKAGERIWDEQSQRYHTFILDWLSFEGDRYTQQAIEIRDYLSRYTKLRNLTFDASGVGNGVKEILENAGLSEFLNPFVFTGGQLTSDLWSDLAHTMPNKALRHFPMGARWKRSDGLDIPYLDVDTRRFIEEMTDLIKEYRGLMLKCHAPEESKKHDDYAASSALSNYGVRNFAGFRIEGVPEVYNPETGEGEGTLTVDTIFKNDRGSISPIGGQGVYWL